MSIQNCDVTVILRDSEGVQVGSESAIGTTDDDGATVVINYGYVPNILDAAPSDITRTLLPPPVPLAPPSGVSRTDDAGANTSTLSFT